MRNFTPPNAADNHQYRATTLKRIRNIFASIPKPDEKSVNTWIETFTGTLHEYYELIYPNGMGVTFEDNKGKSGEYIRFVIENSDKSGCNTRFWQYGEHLKAKEMHKFFDIKIDAEAVLDLAVNHHDDFTQYVAVRLVCRDPINFNKSVQTNQTVWLINPARIIETIDQRTGVEDNIVDLMSGNAETMPEPFCFQKFCRIFMRTYDHGDKRDLIANVLQEQIRTLGIQTSAPNWNLRFDLAVVLGFWPQANENHVKKDSTGYYDTELVEIWDAEMTLAVWTHIQPIRPEIFTVRIVENKVDFVSHDYGRTDWLEGRRDMTTRTEAGLRAALEA